MEATSKVLEIDHATERDLRLIAASRGEEAMSSDKTAALREASEALRSVRASHAVIGGVAVAIRAGVPRATLDTNFAVTSTVDRALVVRTFEKAGFRFVGEFVHSVNLRHKSGEPVQLAFDRGFDEMIGRAEAIKVGDIE